jgi:FKBP-type peptidyl-prolyl cis-trans isomerase FkpA
MRARWMWVAAAVALAGCEKVPEPEGRPASTEAKPEVEAPKELVKEDLEVGTGPTAETGDRVKVHYTGRILKTNAKFDSSRDRNEPFAFTLGQGEVIKGWDQGVVGMKVGGKRKLTIPPDLAYGDQEKPKIPAKSTLVFDVELVEVEGKSADGAAGAAGGSGDEATSPPSPPPAPKPKPRREPDWID